MKKLSEVALGELGRHEEALIHQKKALELRRSNFGDQNQNVAKP
jgi:hypothetical protein